MHPNIAATLIEPSAESAKTSAAGNPRFGSTRLSREFQTVDAMLRIYCRGQRHQRQGISGLCAGCEQLLAYAALRLERCRFGGQKPTCGKCPVHCYQPARREQMRAVMRFSGPRLVWRHPVLVVCHWLDGLRHAA
jgi:hypothetical protein